MASTVVGGLLVLGGALYFFLYDSVSLIAGIGLYLEMIAGILLVVFGLLQALGK